MPMPKIDSKYHPLLIKIGLNVAYYRKLANLTQEELAGRVDLSRNTISKIENSDVYHGISLNTIFRLAEALDISMRDLFDFRDGN